jgi:hypothetical protein
MQVRRQRCARPPSALEKIRSSADRFCRAGIGLATAAVAASTIAQSAPTLAGCIRWGAGTWRLQFLKNLDTLYAYCQPEYCQLERCQPERHFLAALRALRSTHRGQDRRASPSRGNWRRWPSGRRRAASFIHSQAYFLVSAHFAPLCCPTTTINSQERKENIEWGQGVGPKARTSFAYRPGVYVLIHSSGRPPRPKIVSPAFSHYESSKRC